MSLQATLAANIKRYRKERGILQRQLAYMTALSLNTISAVECGRANITIQALERLATALNLEPGELLR